MGGHPVPDPAPATPGWTPAAVVAVPWGAWRAATRAAATDPDLLYTPALQTMLGHALVGLWNDGWLRETPQVPPDPDGTVAVNTQPLRDLQEILTLRAWFASAVAEHPCPYCMVPAGAACIVGPAGGPGGVHWTRLELQPVPPGIPDGAGE